MSDSPNDPITASADAISEVAKTGREIVKTTQKAGGWLDKIFGEAIEDAVGLHWSDRVKAKRIERAIYNWERLTELLHKTKDRLTKKGVSITRIVPPKIALGIIENATMEDDDDLHTLWANLLASGLSPDQDEVQKKYISVLADMTSQDAVVFKSLCEEWLAPDRKTKPKQYGSVTYPATIDGLYMHDEIPIIALNRLGLISPGYVDVTSYSPNDGRDFKNPDPFTTDEFRTYGGLETIEITGFGLTFYRTVIA